MTNLLQTMQKPYCEHDAMYLRLNTPLIFRVVFSVISLLLTTKQKNKMTLLGNTSDAKVRAKLLEIVPASMLPKDLGGERETVENMYPPRDAKTIPQWIQRRKTLEVWPPRA